MVVLDFKERAKKVEVFLELAQSLIDILVWNLDNEGFIGSILVLGYDN